MSAAAVHNDILKDPIFVGHARAIPPASQECPGIRITAVVGTQLVGTSAGA